MCDEWMPLIELPLTIEQFRRLPHNPAYKYEYLGDRAVLSPRPKHYHALLDLRPAAVEARVELRRLRAEDVPALEPVFAATFRRIQPFGSLDDATRRRAAKQCLERTVGGGDGPWIERASFVALDNGRPVGAIFLTLLPDRDPCDWDSFHWPGPPPPDCVEKRLGRPHLTWVFVGPAHAGEGVGTALLGAAVNELLALGYTHLASTFLLGNDSSLLWHWRNGFRLLAYPGSKRLLLQRLTAPGEPPTPGEPPG